MRQPVVMRASLGLLPQSSTIEGNGMSAAFMASGRFTRQDTAPLLCAFLRPDVPAIFEDLLLSAASSVQWACRTWCRMRIGQTKCLMLLGSHRHTMVPTDRRRSSRGKHCGESRADTFKAAGSPRERETVLPSTGTARTGVTSSMADSLVRCHSAERSGYLLGAFSSCIRACSALDAGGLGNERLWKATSSCGNKGG
jgi:hypothetical protein